MAIRILPKTTEQAEDTYEIAIPVTLPVRNIDSMTCTIKKETETPDPWLSSSEVADALKHITSEEAVAKLKEFTYAFLTGVAGSGKSYTLMQGVSSGAIKPCIASTTGISAINLGTQTINSYLKYFDTFSLKQNRYDGKLKRYLRGLASVHDSLVIDEVSMMDKDQLQIIYDEVAELNFERVAQGEPEFRLLVTGDALQLPPVPGKDRDGKNLPLPWFFQAQCWEKFEQNTVKLTKVWRQTNPALLDALNAIRRGDGKLGADLLLSAGVSFSAQIDPTFPGTTLIAKNAEVNKYNSLGLMRVAGETRIATTQSWFSGIKPPGEWKNIPGSHNPETDSLRLKKGAYVMILSNDAPAYSFVNGDCGIVKDWELDAEGEIVSVVVELTRGKEVVVNKIVRDQLSPELPAHINKSDVATVKEFDPSMGYYEGAVFSERAKRYIVGQIAYLPIRLGYASTVHKCVAPETMVYSSKGLISIDEIDVGDLVYTGTSMKKVTEKAYTNRPAYLVKTSAGFEIICSGEHPLLTRDNNFLAAENCLYEKVRTQADNFMVIPLRDKEVSADIAWLLGVLVGDGNYTNKSEGQLHIATNDPAMQNRLVGIFNDLGRKVSIRSDGRGLHSTQLEFRRWLYHLGLEYVNAENKTVPVGATRSRVAIASFLQGLFDTDGSVRKTCVNYATSSKKLAQQVQILLELFDIETFIGTYQGTDKPYYQVNIGAKGIPNFKAFIGFSRPYKQEALEQLIPNRIIKNRQGYDLVTDVEDLGISIPMVDICVEGEHVFMANGIVTHNSQGLSLPLVQIDISSHFMGSPAMIYVAMSRAQTIEGVKIVGNAAMLAKKTTTDPLVWRFL